MAKNAKAAVSTAPNKPSKGRSALDTLLLLLAIVALLGSIFCFYYFAKTWDILPRVGVLGGGVALSIILLAISQFGRDAWQYIRGARVELKKITWPTRPELLQTTLAVIIVVTIMAIILGLFDAGVKFVFDTFIFGRD